MRKIISPLWFILMVVMLASCSSLRKAELAAGNDPKKAVAEVTQIMQAAQQDQIDVLADKQFSKGSAFLADANHGLKQGESSDLILGNAAIAKAFFEDARVTAKSRQALASRILTARESALSAGVRKSDALVQRMMEIDNDLKSETKQFSRSLDPEDFSEFQKKYLALEVMAVQFRELSGAKQAIEQAKDKDARNVAPETLQAASLDYEAAMNMIAQSPRSPNLYKKSVDDALASATLLVDVMNVITGAKGTPEKIAIQIVKQKRALGELSTSVGKLEANLQSTQQSLQEKEGVLKTQEAQLARASTQVRFQQAMDEAQKELSPDDALVYQQGNNLVFRLKRINFQSGTAVIPEFSKLLLSKVDAIIKKLDAEKVVVEGHTDSVGSTEVNQRLSTERATAVANYLFALRGGYKIQYVGYGESQPIASNETAAGRATNRRVDLVVSVKQ
jgi:OOP family OmpA-OmpF porin